MVRLRDSWPFSLSSAPTVGNPCRPLQPESESGWPAPEHGTGPLPSSLEDLAKAARGYAARKDSANTRRAYESDWRQFARWCRRQGLDADVPDPGVVGLYLTAS